MKVKRFLTILVGVLFLLTMVPLTGHAEVPQSINYQGLLTGSDGNTVLDGDYEMSFAIYDAPTDGTSLWSESQTVTVTNGIYNVILGQPGNLLDPDIFEGGLYLSVTVGADAEMTPRQKLVSTPFAMKAAKADDADTLDDMDSLDFALSSHDHAWEEISGRPSGLDDGDDVGITSETDPTVLASVKDGVSWGELSSIPAGFADSVDNEGLTTETDPTVLASVKDGVSWTEVTNKPSGFADGVDNEGVTTLSDYGRSGVASHLYEGTSTLTTKYVNATGDTMSGSTSSSVLRVTNNGTGYGVYGHATGESGRGVYGYAPGESGRGVYGYAPGESGFGVYGYASNTGNVYNYGGYFRANGASGRGVYGYAGGESGRGVYGYASGTSGHGVEGKTSGSEGIGVYGLASGSSGVGIYGRHIAGGKAGEFEGDVHVTGEITREYTTGTANSATPIAYAFIESDGDVSSGTPNVSATWNSVYSRYEITIDGEDYFWKNYVTVVTPSGGAYIAETGSVSGMLLVSVYNLSGSKIQKAFQFVTYKP